MGCQMENNGEKKKSVNKERIFDIFCLAASYIILFLLPQKISLFFYILFGIAAFLFCIGFFRLGLTYDTPSGAKSGLPGGLFFAVFGVLINTSGVYIINQEQGSGRSITIATLLLIEALVMFSIAGSDFRTPQQQRLTVIVFRAAAVLLVIFGTAFAIRKHFSESSVIVLTMLLIESICFWKMQAGNSRNSEIQAVPGLRAPLTQLQENFAGVRTQLGYPWIGKVQTIKQDAVIYGPSEDGFVIYGYYLFGRFYVAGSTKPLFPAPEDAQNHKVEEVPDGSGRLLNKEELTEAYVKMFSRYAENGDTVWSSD